MAIFHLSAKTVSRGKGQSGVAKAAYNARDKLRDEQTGELKDYSRAAGVEFSAIFAPKMAPAWARDRATLWNEVERTEKRKDAQLAREITLGLPHELTGEQRRQLVTDFVREQFTRQGMIADVNIHAPGGKGDDRNHHAHILLTMREIGPDGFGPKAREWNSREQIEKWREAWERTQNRYLERHGHTARVDRRTLEAQGIDREPTTHLGPHAFAIEQRKGIETERGKISRGSPNAEQEAAKLKRELAAVTRQIAALEFAATTDAGAPARFERAARATVQRRGPAANDNQPRVGTVIGRGVGEVGSAAGTVLGGVAKGIDNIADGIATLIAPPIPRTAAQIAADNERQESAANEMEQAWEKTIRAAEDDRKASQQEETRRRELERENWQKRQRDGRER